MALRGRGQHGSMANTWCIQSKAVRPDRAQLWVDHPGPQVSGDRWLCKTGPVEEGETVGQQKKLTHLWQGVAPGSDGQTHRIFDRAQD